MAFIRWMDEILHHLRNPGMMAPLKIPNNKWFQPWFHFVVRFLDFATIHSRGSLL